MCACVGGVSMTEVYVYMRDECGVCEYGASLCIHNVHV